MEITVSQAKGHVPVTILHLNGQLDGQNYQELIAKAQELFDAGTHDFLLDLANLTYISIAGLIALHTIALMTRGETPPDPNQGWAAVKSMDRTRSSGPQKHLKLLNLRPEVSSVLEMVGFSQMFESFTKQEEAIQSF